MTNLTFLSVVATLTLTSGCGGQTGDGTASTNPAAAGSAPGGVGGSSAGKGGTGASTGGAATASGGASAGNTTGGSAAGGSAGAVAAGMGGQSANGGSPAAGAAAVGGNGGSDGGNGGGAGMCPDFQAGFAGGPAKPDLAPEGLSCAGGLTCAGRSCCESIRVKGGLLHMGTECEATCDPDSICPSPFDSSPEIDIQITDFAFDTFPVTVARFRKFVDAYTGATIPEGAGADPNVKGSGWYPVYNQKLLPSADALRASLLCDQKTHPGLATWTDAPGANENKSINCVDWFHAFAFCIWDGGWLPIEATWEYAAAGGAEDRLYPWGEPPPDTTLVPVPCAAGGPCDAASLPEVGAFPAGAAKWGHLDLSGYFAQWSQDPWHPYDKGCNPGATDCFHPSQVSFGPEPVMIRGGGAFQGSGRTMKQPNSNDSHIGARCAR